MHIAFVIPRFYPYRGGYENHILLLARFLRGAGNRTSVFTTTALDLESFWLEGFRTCPLVRTNYDGIEIHRFPISYRRWLRRAGRILGTLPDWRLKAKFARPAFPVRGLAEALRESRPDVIHVGPLPYSALMSTGIAEARRRRVPILTTPCVHFGEENNNQISSHFTHPFQIRVLNECDRVLTLTRTEAQRLERLGVSPRKLVFCGTGIEPADVTGGDPNRFKTKYGVSEPIVLHLGMKAPDKGTPCVIESMKILWLKGVRAHLVLAGPSLSSFERYVLEQAPYCQRVLNLGPVDDTEKRDLLAAADVVVQPSRVESLGLVLLEAWANGKPIIAADIAVSRELVDPGNDGLLVPFGDRSALADAIFRLLRDSATRTMMGMRGKQKMLQHFSADSVIRDIIPLFSAESKFSLRL